jgi:hypothetical protein
MVSLVDVVLGAHVWDPHWGDGMPAERLLDDGINIWEVRTVFESRELIWSDDAV